MHFGVISTASPVPSRSLIKGGHARKRDRQACMQCPNYAAARECVDIEVMSLSFRQIGRPGAFLIANSLGLISCST